MTLVEVSNEAPVATVTLNRPRRHNSLVPELLRDLVDAIEKTGRDEEVKAVVLAAAGKSFSTGGDVRAFFDAGDELAAYADETVGLLNHAMLTMMGLDKPVIAAVHGMVTGGSLGLLLASDVVLLAPESTITPWYSVVGYSPDGGWTALLGDIIGTKRAARTLLLNETITAADAVAWGLASEIVPADRIHARAGELATEVAAMRPAAIHKTKHLVHGDLDSIAARLQEEKQNFVDQVVTAEAMAGMRAFLGVVS